MSLSGNASADNLLVGNVKGLNSIHGKSAYELAVIHGFEGTEEEWIASLKGEKGDTYNLTEADKKEIADIVAVDNLEESAKEYLDSLAAEENLIITRTATGNAITIDSANAPLQNLKLYGKTEQDGTPTPDNPIELKSVGDSGSYEVGVYGKNIFNINGNVNFIGATGAQTNLNSVTDNILTCKANGTTSHAIGQKIRVNVGDTITFSAKVLSLGTGAGAGVFIYENGKNSVFQYCKNINETAKVTHTAKTNEIICAFITESGYNAQFTDIQVEFGTQATPYEEYKGQTLTFTDTLRGVGDIADEKDFARGVTIQRFEKVVYDGSSDEKWSYHDAPTFPLGKYALVPLPKPTKYNTETNTTNTLCDRFKSVANVASAYVDGVVSLSKYALAIVKNEFSDENSVREWLQANPITVVYEIETPIETPLTETELNAYRQLMTNKGTTTILSEAEMEVDYYINKPNAQAIGNIHSQVNKDYLKLQQAIISTGGN